MDNKILYDENGSTPLKGKEISFSNLTEGMKISFQNEEDEFISAEVVELYVAEEDENIIIGCAASDSEGTSYALYEEDGTIIYSTQDVVAIKPTIQKQEVKPQIQNEQKKIIMPVEETKATPKKEVDNLFKGRTESEKGNAKFPDWDIVPANQFINPRVKPQ